MDGILKKLRNAICEMDALDEGKAYGRLIVDLDASRVYIETNYEDVPELDVAEGDLVEVITYDDDGNRTLTAITREQAISTMTSDTGWPLFAGFDAFVRKKRDGK